MRGGASIIMVLSQGIDDESGLGMQGKGANRL
jgi:hypothetical protein